MKSVFIPVPVDERLPETDCTVDVMYDDVHGLDTCVFTVVYSKEKGFFDPNGNYNCTGITHWLEKKEDVFVLTKEELEKVFEAGEDCVREWLKDSHIADIKFKDFNDWLNTQKP